MEKKYIPIGEGIYINPDDPDDVVYGLSDEMMKQREREYYEESIIERYYNEKRIEKAVKLIREYDSRRLEDRITLLKKLGYTHVNTKKGKISLEKITEEEIPYVIRFYEKTMKYLREVIEKPYKECKITERLDSME